MNQWEWLLSPRLAVAMALLAAGISASGGCGRSRGKQRVTKSTSVTELLAKLPNLKTLDIESCSYTIQTSSLPSRLPSPSDIRLELKGSLLLSEEGYTQLRAGFVDWKPVSRDMIPASLLSIVPVGDMQMSESLNESFDPNPRYTHAYVVVLEQDHRQYIYLLATDMDHPIE